MLTELLVQVETFVCATEPSKLAKCQKSRDETANFMVQKFTELKNLLSKNIVSHGSSAKMDSQQEIDEDLMSVRTIECPDSHTIKVLDALMTNKNKFICPVPAEKVDSTSVCNSTTETMTIVQKL